MQTIKESARNISIWENTNVVVAGGGPAGVAAAIAVAKEKASVFLIERYGFLGGMATAGEVLAWNNWAIDNNPKEEGGIYREIVDEIRKEDGLVESTECPIEYMIEPEATKRALDNLMNKYGIKLLLHTYVTSPIMDEDKIKGIIVENKSGRGAIMGDRIIDCTGDGDIMASCGVPFEKGRPQDGKMQPGSLMFRMANVDIKKLEKYINGNPGEQYPPPVYADQSGFNDISKHPGIDHTISPLKEGKARMYVGFPTALKKAKEDGFVLSTNRVVFNTSPQPGVIVANMTRVTLDATNAWNMTKAEIEGRKQAKLISKFFIKYIPGFKNSWLMNTAPQLGLRETRRMKGEYILTREDVTSGKVWEDTITSIYNAGIDIHEPDSKGFTLIPVTKPINIPYRCLLPKNIKNLLVAGRCISVTHEALATVRAMHKVMCVGQAAGVAAAISVKDNVPVKNVNIQKLQDILRKQNLVFEK